MSSHKNLSHLLHRKKKKCGGAQLSDTSPQTTRVTFQSTQSNIEDAHISFPAQRRFLPWVSKPRKISLESLVYMVFT